MSSVYILSDYGKLVKKAEALVFISPEGDERKILLHRTDRIIISGKIEISAGAFRLLMYNKVDTMFVSSNGTFNGKIAFQDGKNVFLRKLQFEVLNKQEQLLEIVRSLVLGKLKNQLHFMQRINRKSNDDSIDKAVRDINRIMIDLESTTNIDSARGYEGYDARLFFSVLKKNINPDWAIFNGRSMHPPKDNVNAVLSFLYTLLFYRIESILEMESLDVFVGYLHTLDYGKKGLAYDLMEEYRTSICDTLTCALFNLGILKDTDFEVKAFGADDIENPLDVLNNVDVEPVSTIACEKLSGVLLTKDGLKKVAKQFEEKLESLIFYLPQNEKLSYQQVMIAQIRHFKRVLLGEEKTYKAFVIK